MSNTIPDGAMPGDTFSMASTDASQGLTASSIVGSSGNPPVGAFITIDTNDIKYAMGGTTPVQGGTGHLADVSTGAGCEIWLYSGNAVKTFRFISNVSSTHGRVTCTPFFEAGKT